MGETRKLVDLAVQVTRQLFLQGAAPSIEAHQELVLQALEQAIAAERDDCIADVRAAAKEWSGSTARGRDATLMRMGAEGALKDAEARIMARSKP